LRPCSAPSTNAAHNSGSSAKPFRLGHHGSAVVEQAEIAEQHEPCLHAGGDVGRHRAARISRDRIDFALGQQPVAHLVVDLNAYDLRQIEARVFGKGRKEGILARGYRRGQLSAFEVLRCLDRPVDQHADAHRRVICAGSERHRRQPLNGLKDRGRRRAHAEIEPSFSDRLRRGHGTGTAGDVDIEPVLLPEAHALGDKGEQIAALGDPRQSKMNSFLVLRKYEAG